MSGLLNTVMNYAKVASKAVAEAAAASQTAPPGPKKKVFQHHQLVGYVVDV